MEDKKEDKEYYTELQAALRCYDDKIWIIPSLFFILVGIIEKNNPDFFPWDLIFLLILMLFQAKANFFHIFIQKKINGFDKNFKRWPLSSMTKEEIDEALRELEEGDGNEKAEFYCFQKFFIKFPIPLSRIILGAMLFYFLYLFYTHLIRFNLNIMIMKFTQIGLILNILGSLFIAFSIGKSSGEGYCPDKKGNKTYLAAINYPCWFKVGISLLILGFIFSFIDFYI
jgi:hypothetical protein